MIIRFEAKSREMGLMYQLTEDNPVELRIVSKGIDLA
jgi:hypothetical protein